MLRAFQDDELWGIFFLILKNIELPAATLAPIGTTSFLVAAGAKRRP
ncbi:hypothetical protein [Chryseobacterium wanjuense]|nr:hypothetical protein [Chryseobacterium wanjuense]